MELTVEQAARVALHFQRLDKRRKASPSNIYKLVQQLGSLQLDTINVVERSHHLVLYSRLEDYKPQQLDEPLYKQRSLCDFWTNVAAIIPSEDYDYYHYEWNAHRAGWHSATDEFRNQVRQKAPRNRPFTTDDFEESMQGRRKEAWRSSALSNALDILTLEGYFQIHHREGTRKFYAWRTEKPKKLQASTSMDRKLTRFLLQRSLSSLGIGTLQEIQVARLRPVKSYREEAESMLKDGTFEKVKILGLPEQHYILSEKKEEIKRVLDEHADEAKATLLSPLDNLIINRKRTFKLFGFYPQFEAYVPKNKRKYGYFNMPILYGEKLVGYIDPKLDRKTGITTFNKLSVTHIPDDAERAALAQEFARFLDFHNSKKLEIKNSYSTTNRKQNLDRR